MSRAENVSESEIMNSHIPNFFELMANFDAPPDHGDSTMPSNSVSLTLHLPRERSRNKKTHSPSIKCQYMETTSIAVPRATFRVARNCTYSSARIPPSRCKPCAPVKTKKKLLLGFVARKIPCAAS